jgi:hypothetical protein
MRAFFADGVDKMHVPWAVEGLPTLLHLSLFLFFGGLVIFLFNVHQGVFTCVVLWIGLFSMMYVLITVLPLIRQYSPYYTPLSIPAWFLNASIRRIPYVIVKLLTSLTFITRRYGTRRTWLRCYSLRMRYRGLMLEGLEKMAEEMASKQSSEVDVRILGWTIRALGDDDSLEKFFEAIPGLFKSKLVKHLERDLPRTDLFTFWDALDGLMGRTLSSNSVTQSVKERRDIICRDIISMIPHTNISGLPDNLRSHFDQAPVPIWRLQAMARWFTHKDGYVVECARVGVARNLARMQERDDDWIVLAHDVFGLSERVLQDNIDLGRDDALLATLIDVSRRVIRSGELRLVQALTQFNMRHTLPGLQHDFCTLWNELVQEARNQRLPYTTPVRILREIRHLYIALHQGTDAAPTAFSASTFEFNPILYRPSSYPLCDIASHRPDSTAHVSVPNSTQPDASPYLPSHGGSTVPQQAGQASTIARPPSPSDLTTPGEIGVSCRALSSPPSPVHTSPHPTYASPSGTVAAPPQDILPGATSPHPREGTTTQRDIVTPGAGPDVSEIFSTASKPAPTPTLAPAPTPTPPDLNKLLASYDAGAASASNPLLPASSAVGFFTPAPPPLSSVPAPPTAEIVATGFVCSDDPTSQAPVAPLIQHPDPVPATIIPSTGPDPSDDSDALQSTPSSAYLSQPLEGGKQQDTVVSRAAPDISDIPSTVNTIPLLFPPSPNIVVSDSQSSPTQLSAPSSGMTAAEPSSFVESAPLQPDHFPHALQFPSSSLTTASSHISPQVASGSGVQVTSSIGTPSSHHDTHDLNRAIPMTVLPHSDQLSPPAHDIIAVTLEPEDQAQHERDAL